MMEVALAHALNFMECHEIALCESVSRSWLHSIKKNHIWKRLCTFYFSVLPETIEALRDEGSGKEEFWKEKEFCRPHPVKHKRFLDIYDYLVYFQTQTIDPWKRFFLFCQMLFYKGVIDKIDYDARDQKMLAANQFGGDLSGRMAFATEFASIFARECKSRELESILENYYIFTSSRNSYGFSIQSHMARQFISHLTLMKKQSGYKITKESQDAFSLLFRRVMFSFELNQRCGMSKETIDLLDESYALEMYTLMLNIDTSSQNSYVAESWNTTTTEILAYFGYPPVLAPVLQNVYGYEVITIFEDEKDPEEVKTSAKESEIVREESDYFFCKRMGIPAMVAHLLEEDIPTDKTCTTKVIEDMRRLVESNEDTRFKIWALCTVVKYTEFYNFWRTKYEYKAAITNMLLQGLIGKNQDWETRRVAQRVITRLGQLKELDVITLQAILEDIVDETDVATLPLAEVQLGTEGNIFCWALLVLILLDLGDKQKHIRLGEQLFLHVPNLSPEVRNDTLKYFGMFIRDYTHPRWLIEAAMMGVEFKDGQYAYWAEAREDKKMPQAAASLQLQKEILCDIGDTIENKGFCHCESRELSPVSGVGTYYGLLLAPSSTGKAIDLWLSEVGRYALLRVVDEKSYIPRAIKDMPKSHLDSDEMLSVLRKILEKHGVKIMEQPELGVDLTDYSFKSDLGSVGNHYHMRHTVETLLFFFTD